MICFGTSPLDVIINEVAWMGTKVSANDEWIELYNNSNTEIDLKNWSLITQDEAPEISLSGTIKAQGFFILERTDDESAPNIQANQIYTGALNNKGERLQLINNKGIVIDEVNCSDGWFAGNNKTKQTMEKAGFNWQTSREPEGTPGMSNSKGAELKPKPSEKNGSHLIKYSKEVIIPEGVIINELLPSSKGPDAENEYIEIFNQNNFPIDVSGWSLQDTEGKTSVFLFPEKTIIKGQGFLVFFRPQTKITLNNSGDGLRLKNPNNEIADEVFYYKKAGQAESFNKVSGNWVWGTTLTPGTKNIVSPTQEESMFQKTNQDKKGQEISQKEGIGVLESLSATITRSNSAPRYSKNSLAVLFTALPIAIVSGILILVLKRRNKNQTR